jgi:hypothetical protein
MISFIFGEKGQLLLAGAMGGIVRWMTLRDHWSDGLIAVLVGALCAVFVGPVALPLLQPVIGNLNVPPESIGSLSGFLIGIGGLTVSGLLIDFWRLRRTMLRSDRQAAADEVERQSSDGEPKP